MERSQSEREMIGRNIRHRRQVRGWTVDNLTAFLAWENHGYLDQVEAGEVSLEPEALAQLSRLFNTQEAKFFLPPPPFLDYSPSDDHPQFSTGRVL